MGVWTRAIIQFLDQGNCLPLLVATSFINRCFKTLILVRIILRSFNWTYILNVLIKRRTQADSLYQEIFSISPMDNLSTPSPFTHCPKYFFPPGVQGNICIVFRWRPILPASPRPPPEEQLQDQSGQASDVFQDGGHPNNFNPSSLRRQSSSFFSG